MSKILLTLVGLCIFGSYSLGQEPTPVENVKPLDWADFQATQEEMVKQQLAILDALKEIRESNRQINLNILSWQTAKQDILQAVGNTGCDFWQTDQDRNVKWGVLGLAALGVFLVLHFFLNLFKKKEVKTA